MIQRAGEAGAMMLASTKQTIAGEFAANETQEWEQLAGSTDGLSSTYSSTAGIYQGQGKLMAINRSEGEDASTIVPEERVEMLFANLDFDRVNQTADNDSSLIQEVWRLFLILVLVALIGEAFLCIPKRVTPAAVSSEYRESGPAAGGFANNNAGSNSENVSVGGAV